MFSLDFTVLLKSDEFKMSFTIFVTMAIPGRNKDYYHKTFFENQILVSKAYLEVQTYAVGLGVMQGSIKCHKLLS